MLEEASSLVGGLCYEFRAGRGEAAGHFGIGGDEGGVDRRDAGAGESAGEGTEQVEIKIREALPLARDADQRVVALVNPARVAKESDHRIEERKLGVRRRNAGLQERPAEAGDGPVEEDLPHLGERGAEAGVVEQIAGVFGPHHDGVNALGPDLLQARGEEVGVVPEQLGAPGGAEDQLAVWRDGHGLGNRE